MLGVTAPENNSAMLARVHAALPAITIITTAFGMAWRGARQPTRAPQGIRNRPVSSSNGSGRLSKGASAPAPKVSSTADTPLKMASARMARRRNTDGLVMAVLLLG